MTQEMLLSRKRGNRLVAGSVAVATVLGSLLWASPAMAGDSLCSSISRYDSCGDIFATTSTQRGVNIATNYIGNGQVNGVMGYLSAGQSSNSLKSGGLYRDWDAAYVTGGYCMTLYTGVTHTFRSTDNRIGTYGIWHKVDNWGADVHQHTAGCF